MSAVFAAPSQKVLQYSLSFRAVQRQLGWAHFFGFSMRLIVHFAFHLRFASFAAEDRPRSNEIMTRRGTGLGRFCLRSKTCYPIATGKARRYSSRDLQA